MINAKVLDLISPPILGDGLRQIIAGRVLTYAPPVHLIVLWMLSTAPGLPYNENMVAKGPEDIYSFIGRRIREERKARGMTLEDVASRATMNASFLHYIEKSKKKPSLGTVGRIAGALGLPLDILFSGSPLRKPCDTPAVRRITELVREASPKRRAAILKVVQTLARPD